MMEITPMFWFIASSFLLVMIGLGMGYLIAIKMYGKEVAASNLLCALPWLFIGFILALGLEWLKEPYRDFMFPVVYVLGFGFWLLSWPVRKRDAGDLLLQVGRTFQNKVVLLIGIFEAVCAALLTIGLLSDSASSLESIRRQISLIAIFWTLSVVFLTLGLSKLELREKGICYMFTFISWSKIKSYTWGLSKPNTLIVKYRPRFPLNLGMMMSLSVPAEHRAEIDRIVSENASSFNR